jgi:formylglycine-generating enzyme required for sulfatase activity/tRNA A-37 threonylcarbamoyl transferase component Bud32
VPAKCPKCGGEARLEAIREAGGRCPHCKARIKIRFTGVPRPVKRAPGRMPGVHKLRSSLESIGPYEVVSEISRGGMGIVYKARDTKLKKLVAIKVLIRGGQASEEERKRFQREAESAARLQHSNIVPIHSVGICDGLPYFVMDFIEGEQLDLLIDRGSVSPRQALDYTEQLADALAYAHAAGVIHRDIKPANVIIDRYGRPQLMDFGLAKEVDAADRTQLTQVGTTMGTPTYMPPEQAEGDLEGIDAQSDVYSLGAVLYEMLTGQPPFEGPTTMAILMKVLEEEPSRPRRLNPRIHRDIETICLKAMAKEKRERYKSAEELREDVQRFKAGEAINAAQPGNTRVALRWARRHGELVGALLLAIFGLGGWAGYRAWKDHEERLAAAKLKKRRIETMFADAEGCLRGGAPGEEQLERAASFYRRILDLDPGKADEDNARSGLQSIEQRRRRRRIRFFLDRGQKYLRRENYEAAADMFTVVIREYEPKNREAAEGLRVALGDGTLVVSSEPSGAQVYLATGRNFAEPPLDAAPERLGRPLGATPFSGPVKVPMGLHRITLVKKGYGRQSVPALVGRNADVGLGTVKLVKGSAVGSVAAATNLIPVPAGKVTFDDGTEEKVAAFYIDRYEYPNRLGIKPVCGKTLEKDKPWGWQQAEELAKRAGKRLPSQAQWILAAEGPPIRTPEGPRIRTFPYGFEFDPGAAAVGMAQKDGPLPCGSKPGDRSASGAYDMSGNVSEWIRDPPQPKPDPREEAPPADDDDDDDVEEFPPPFLQEEDTHDACGGNWTSRPEAHSECRYVRMYTSADKVQMQAVGLRCVLEVGKKVVPRKSAGGPAKPDQYKFKEVWKDGPQPGMVLIRPQPGTKAHALVPYAFLIDKYEWPNKAKSPPWRGTWYQAYALARKSGKRLPTRAEWQVACGGPDLKTYPFGDRWDVGEERPAALGLKANEQKNPFPCGSFAITKPHWGKGKAIYDLCGNLSEWVFDRYEEDPRLRGVVGGCWWSKPDEVGTQLWKGKDPGTKGKDGGVTGFRCVVRLRLPESKK